MNRTDERWRGSVTCGIDPRSFQNDTGDGFGDLEGITRRLDDIADLGDDAIWLSPVFTSPMADTGYDVPDHRDIDYLRHARGVRCARDTGPRARPQGDHRPGAERRQRPAPVLLFGNGVIVGEAA